MNRSRAQSKRFSRTSRAIGLALVLALLSLQQAWAAAFAMCDDEGQPQAALSSCTNHQPQPAEEHKAGAHHHSCGPMHQSGEDHSTEAVASPPQETSHPQSEAVSATGSGRTGDHSPCSLSCCQVQPQSEAPVVSNPVQQQALAVSENPPQLALGLDPPVPTTNVYKPPRSRPVYLTISSFLI